MPDRFSGRHWPGTLWPGRLWPGRLWIDRFIAALPQGAAILDLGCGGGEPIARFLIDHGFRITGVDRDPNQIVLAQTRFPRERWIEGDMRDVDIPQGFAGVLAWNSLASLSRDEQGRMVGRASLWLQPGGRLLFNIVTHDSATNNAASGLPHHADLGAADYSAAIAMRGLIEMAHVASDPACNGAAIWLARKP